jgi:hypothetical protein
VEEDKALYLFTNTVTMIFSLFILVGSTILAGILAFFPASDGVSETVTNGISTIANYMYVFNGIFAMDVLFSCLLIYLSFELVLLGIQMVRWFLRFIPFFGNKV